MGSLAVGAVQLTTALQAVGLYHQKIHVLSEMNKTIACSVARAERDAEGRRIPQREFAEKENLDYHYRLHDERDLAPERVGPRGLRRWIPSLQMLRVYQRGWLLKDVTAGLVLTAILVPVGMGYAEAAGLPAIYGLYATIVPLIAYAIFGPSRILVLGPDSSLAAMIAAVIVPLAVAGASVFGVIFPTSVACRMVSSSSRARIFAR